jgi:DNA-binding NarL/FixJ family response regulator
VLEHIGSATSVDALHKLNASLKADVLVIDLDSYFEQALLEELPRHPETRVVLLTSSQDKDMLDQSIISGVRGIVRRQDPPEVLLKAVEKVHHGELWIDRSATARIFMELVRQKAGEDNDPDRAKISTLTTREREMIRAVACDTGVPGKVIASRLCISEHTLRNHLSSIYSKLGLNNRLDLYAFATRHRLDRPEGGAAHP